MFPVEDLTILAKRIKFWDIAAGVIIVKEAGGFVKVLNNKKSDKKKDIFASNSLFMRN